MSYSIIFKTVIVKANDGRVIHFSRSGCNNDNCGRNKDEFSATIYNSEYDFVNYATGFMHNSKPYKDGGNFDLKIGGRAASDYDYGAHLLRMLKKAKSEDEYGIGKIHFYGRINKGVFVELVNGEEYNKLITDTKEFTHLLFSSDTMRYKHITENLYSISDIFALCDSGRVHNAQFCIA